MSTTSDPTKLVPNPGMLFESGKTYTHAQGLSCCFRQWRATDSHCRFLHGYSLQVTITFRAAVLDHRNWVVNFGGLKKIKEWLESTFDHKTLVAKDDPELGRLRNLAGLASFSLQLYGAVPIIQLVEVEHVGCEAFAKIIYDHVAEEFLHHPAEVECVEVREHEGNFARYRRES